MQTRTALRFAPEQEAPPEVARAYAAVTPKDRIYTKAPPAPVWIEPSWSFWGSGFGGVAKLDGDAAVGSQDVTSRIAGGAAGADYRLWPNTKIGFALAGGETSFTLANGYGSGHSDFFQGSIYGKSYFGPAYVTGAVAGGAQWVKNDRTVIIGPVFDTLTASYTLPVVAGRLESGYRWFSTPYFGVTPYAAVQAQTAFLPGFTETPTAGTGATANVVASQGRNRGAERARRLVRYAAVVGDPVWRPPARPRRLGARIRAQRHRVGSVRDAARFDLPDDRRATAGQCRPCLRRG